MIGASIKLMTVLDKVQTVTFRKRLKPRLYFKSFNNTFDFYSELHWFRHFKMI